MTRQQEDTLTADRNTVVLVVIVIAFVLAVVSIPLQLLGGS